MARALLTPQQQSTLAERVRSRDPSAEEELVRFFSPRVAFLALERTHDPETARDLAQEVMLAVVRGVRGGQLRDSERLASFVFGTTRNVINNYLRNRSRLPAEDPLDSARDLASQPHPDDHDERIALVRRALGTLHATDRKILWLTLVEGLKPGEIASRLGLTAELIRTRKSRAVKKMIERVKERHEDERERH
jgi:RNA polymerase sigma-70 factor (ECF subfamily)